MTYRDRVKLEEIERRLQAVEAAVGDEGPEPPDEEPGEGPGESQTDPAAETAPGGSQTDPAAETAPGEDAS